MMESTIDFLVETSTKTLPYGVGGRQKGKCDQWTQKGTGFIRLVDGRRVFVRSSDIFKEGGRFSLKRDEVVFFQLGADEQGRKKATLVTCNEDFEALAIDLYQFMVSKAESKSFPPTLTACQRKFVHHKAQDLGLFSCSQGEGPDRYIRVTHEAEMGFLSSSEEKVLKLKKEIQICLKLIAAEPADRGTMRVSLGDLNGKECEELRTFCWDNGLDFCTAEKRGNTREYFTECFHPTGVFRTVRA